MANKLQFTISAIDKATAVVQRVNGSISRLTRPAVQVGQSLRALGSAAGMGRVAQGIGGIGRAASDVAGRVSSMLAPLGLIAGGSILAGLVALTLEWSHLGAEVGRTARTLGLQVDELQSLRGAAGLAGVGAQELTGGLKSLGDTLEDALYGRNQQALVVLNRLGVGIHHTADGSIDAARGMRELSAAIAGVKNVQVQGLIARTFGLESVLPLLRQGPAAIAAYEAKVRQLGGVMSGPAVEAAEQFQLSLNYLHAATQGVRSAIASRLLPVLQPLVDRFTNWIAANRELIATNIGAFVEGLVQRINELDFNKISDDVHSFVSAAQGAVQVMGGWKNAAIMLAVALNGNLIASVINLGLAFGRLGIAMLTTPFGLLVTAIAAVAFGVYAIYKNWDNIGAYFSKKIGAVKAAFDRGWLGGVVRLLWEFNPIKIASDTLNGLSKWLFNFDLYEAGSHVLGSMVKGMKGAVRILPKSVLKFLGIEDWAQPSSPAVSPPAPPVGVAAPASRAVQTSARPALRGPNNNPGNLRGWGNAPRDANGFAVFPSVQDGLSAAVRNLVAQQQKHGLNTIRGVISKWAPSSENNTGAYISDVSGRTGFSADQQLNLQDPKVVAPLISAIVRHEGNSAGVTEQMISQVVAAQLGRAGAGPAAQQKVEVALTLHGLPSGVSASARTSGGDSMPVRVAYSMPTGLTP